MSNLIRGDLKRVFRNAPFYIGLVLVVAYLFYSLISTFDYAEKFYPLLGRGEYEYSIEDWIYTFELGILGTLATLVVSVITVGMDYDGGMIRNKLASGLTKTNIFFSKIIVVLIIGGIYRILAFTISTVALTYKAGPDYISDFFADPRLVKILAVVFISELLMTIFIAVFSASLAINIEKNIIAVILVVVILFAGAMDETCSSVYARSRDQVYEEMHEDHMETVENSMYMEEGPKKVFVQLVDIVNIFSRVMDPIPTYDQRYWGFFLDELDDVVMPLCIRYVVGDTVLIAVVGSIGLEVFKKRNIR